MEERSFLTLNANDPLRTVTWLKEGEEPPKPTNIDNLHSYIAYIPRHVREIIDSIPHGDMQQIQLILKSYI